MTGHFGFIFNICISVTNEYLASSSDDKHVIIFDLSTGESLQKIEHPNTTWESIFINNDIVTTCTDGKIRCFSLNKYDESLNNEFDEEIVSSKAQSAGLSEDELNKLPHVSELKNIRGKKDGFIKIFKNENNKPEA